MSHDLSVAVLVLAASAAAQTQFAELGKRHLGSVPVASRAVVAGDLDRDGDLDLVLANDPVYTHAGYSGGQDRLLLNDGAGRFVDATGTHLPSENLPTATLALGDVDGDGDLDLFVGGPDRLYRNDGTGHFTIAPLPSLPPTTQTATFADVDRDGDLDLLVASASPSFRYSVLINDRTGRFTDESAARIPVQASVPACVATGDLDGDGDLDVIFGSWLFNKGTRLLINGGNGYFTEALGRFPNDWYETTSLALVDVDGDRDLDVVMGKYGNGVRADTLYLNDGRGAFLEAPPGWLPGQPLTTYGIAVADFDGDRNPDLALARGVERNRLYRNSGSGVFTDTTSTAFAPFTGLSGAIVAGDFDGDGDQDLVTVGEASWDEAWPRLQLNDGHGSFVDASAQSFPEAVSGTAGAAFADVDLDGHLDLMRSVGDASWRGGLGTTVLLGDGRGGFVAAPGWLSDLPGQPGAVTFADVDKDRDPDLLVCGDSLRLLVNTGTRFQDETGTRLPPISGPVSHVSADDFDADGDVDLVISRRSGTCLLLVNDGQGRFTETSAGLGVVSLARSAVAVDVDLDGDLDLFFAGPNRLLLNDGRAGFVDVSATRLPQSSGASSTAVAGDVEGDGDPDLFLGGMAGVLVWVNDGRGKFRDETASRVPSSSIQCMSLAFGDLDGDLDGDLFVGTGNEFSSPGYLPNVMLVNDGTGRFVDDTKRRLPPDSDAVTVAALADVDEDGDLDLFIGVRQRRSRLLMNLQRQAIAPWLAQTGLSYPIEIHAAPGYADLFHVVIPLVGSAARRQAIPPYGVLGIDPTAMVALPPLYIPPPGGKAVVTLGLPRDASLVGASVYSQALVLATQGPARFTNVVFDRIR